MMRAIVTPPVLSPAALSELKAWLGIATGTDDAELTTLLMTALELCEGFTGTMPLVATCEDTVPACGARQALSTRPVQAITGVWMLAVDGTRTTLAAGAYAIDIDADGTGTVRLRAPGDPARAVVRYTAGLAADWTALPDALRHGVIRLAAYHHRARDDAEDGKAPSAAPPAAVAALWRPWRRMRLS
ncbi:hypothetical protein [Novosphingobium sp. MD-1]|uniref:head-tail connector protein n=1 Tax=Novosphingobium sp. MD-1 TaxID=1630648 RepID=UPI00061C56FC|nr:hypothetical protein [Novosphingobium sp. MD-1]GAO54945.1 gene transfer agent (GTA) ORFG06 [Novosphingobium sp. MD-1]